MCLCERIQRDRKQELVPGHGLLLKACCFFLGQKRLVAQLFGPLEGGQRAVVPDPLNVGMPPRRAGGWSCLPAGPRQADRQPHSPAVRDVDRALPLDGPDRCAGLVQHQEEEPMQIQRMGPVGGVVDGPDLRLARLHEDRRCPPEGHVVDAVGQ